MATPEQHIHIGAIESAAQESLDPRHFYAAYVFDDPPTRRRDITVLIGQAQQLGFPVRYWWLSEALEIRDSPDRLIVCMHHPSLDEDAGMDLYDTLRQARDNHRVTWDELEAADVDEYRVFGKIIAGPDNIFEPDGKPLFPEPETDSPILFTLSRDNVQFTAEAMLGRGLDDAEMQAVAEKLPGALDWVGAVEKTIRDVQAAGLIGSILESPEPEQPESEMPVREFDDADWLDPFETGSDPIPDAVHIFEGIDEDGQLYVRREWAKADDPPAEFTPHAWGPAFAPDGSNTLVEVLAHLEVLVENGTLTSEDRDRSEVFYQRMFSAQ